ncbi:MAG: hypothetical protein MUE97_07820, partial [Phycisphaerales bacterium]|nr:hypothetical protein [Phycisphaerales bacterium]
PAARVTVGSTWSGAQIQDWNGQRKEYQTDGAKIDSRTGNTFVLRTARPVANSHVLWTIRADGNKLTVVSSEPTNDPGLSYVIHESKGTINGDTMEFYVRSDSVRNGKVIGRSSGTVTLRREDGK